MSTAPKFHTLGTVQIPRGMVWVDEFTWSPVEKALEYALGGALLVDVGVKQAGRPITLQAEGDAGWIRRDALQALQALADEPDGSFLLTLADGREFTVQFAPNPIEATPLGRPELPTNQHPFVATVRLIEAPAP